MNSEDMERRMHWLKLARELDQEDDFRALLDDVRRDVTVCSNCAAATFACTACGARVDL